MPYSIRKIAENEIHLLDDFLYEAIFIPNGVEKPPKSIIKKTDLQVYIENFGKRIGDYCLVAESDGKIIGAVWVRIMNDYGHIDEETPSLAISLYKEYRNNGVGTELMKQMLDLLKKENYKRVSLAVQKKNYAAKMYQKLGFEVVHENKEEYIMVCNLKFSAHLKIKFKLKGGNVMEYKIETKSAFTVIGKVKEFNSDTSYSEIPKFWTEHYKNGDGEKVCGKYGICFENSMDSKIFKYMIADDFNGGEIPSGFETKEIPANIWAIFPCRGAMPNALQEVNTKIWEEWLPNCKEYKIADNCGVELYSDGDMNSPDYYSEVWIPVKKV